MPTFTTPEPILVNLDIGIADIHITLGDRADTVVEIEPRDPASPADVTAARRAAVDYARGVLCIKAHRGAWRAAFRGGAGSIVVRLECPAGSELRGHAALATLRCSGTLGECHYKAAAGDVTIDHVERTAELTTATGTITVERIGGSAAIRNANGDTSVGEVACDLQVKAANGKIAVDRAGAAVTAKTANGDIRIGEVEGGEIIAETAHGKVDVGVRRGVAAWLDLHTAFGKVHNLLSSGERPDPSEDTVAVRARSCSGDITVRRAEAAAAGQGAA